MAKKSRTTPTTTITVRPTAPADVTSTPRPRTLRARRSGDSFELLDDALHLGLVPGDVVSCATGVDGRRYLSGLVRLRSGSLSQVRALGGLCHHHFGEFIEQATDDWHADGAACIRERGGFLYAFWPAGIPLTEAHMAVELSAAEFGLHCTVLPGTVRQDLISRQVSFGPPPVAAAA